MMRTDNKGRSASPHRITYKSDFHAIKCSFDAGISLKPGTKAAAVHPSKLPTSLSDPMMSHTSTSSSAGIRGRIPSTRGAKIRDNIFLQMDSQQLRQDGGPGLSSGSTPLLSPQNSTLQLQSSPCPGSRRSVISSSSVLSTVTSISTPESSLQDKVQRAEEISDIDRAALAQKFSVTRKLFETKMMDVGGQLSKSMISRGKADVRGEVNQVENVEEASAHKMYSAEDGFDKDKSINHIINISSVNPPAATSLTGHLKSPVLDNLGAAANKSPSCLDKLDQTTGSPAEEERAAIDPNLTPEETLRAELVNIKNESSESDENGEEKEWKEDKNRLKSDVEEHLNKAARDSVEALVDDVFEEPSVEAAPGPYRPENRVELIAGDDRPIISLEEYQKDLSVGVRWKKGTETDSKGSQGKYQQVNEQWEGEREEQNRLAWVDREGDVEMDAGVKESVEVKEGVMVKEAVDKEPNGKRDNGGKECIREEGIAGKEELVTQTEHVSDDRDGGKEAVIGGIENEAFVYEQEPQRHPELSPSLGEDWENSLCAENELLEEYEEIPGVPELAKQQQEEEDAAKRKVRFSSAPIKVGKTL